MDTNEDYLRAFRQWRADSHCKFLHGYSFEFEFEFGAHELDERNWVVDFGGLKELESDGSGRISITKPWLLQMTLNCLNSNQWKKME